ncbi:FkbM family methyltransferase [Caldanaerobius polysaccharolyticus]|uniref:FkbM family methyltransferase n=1 Tax=Caldanaerobius polysaccharolyticus TaxID=44256 RepID=UPI00047D60C6|nr:FkbM family methyltransferase [Caldanaerobius polysaccharolyticus]
MYGTYIGNNRVLVSTQWGGMLLVSSDDLSLSPTLITRGVYDVGLTNYLIKTIKPGNTVVDIGANLGYFTVLMGYLVGPNGRVLSYEANPNIFALLQDNISMNYLNKQVNVINKAIYSDYSQLKFYVTSRFMGNSSIHKHNENYQNNYKVDEYIEIEVDAEPLDAHIDEIEYIDFVKVDIEGGEYHALKGMEKLISAGKIDTISFELNKNMLQDDYNCLYKYLKSYSAFKYYIVNDKGDIIPMEVDDIFNHESISNVIIKVQH